MRITFVALGWEQMGISLLSAIAKRDGHEVNLAFSTSLFNDRWNMGFPAISPYFDDTKEVIETIKKQKPDVLCFSALTGTYQWMLGAAKEVKLHLPNVKTVFGGVHVSAVPERVLAQPQVDYVVVGEGEVAFPEILKAIERDGPGGPIVNTRFKWPDGQIIKGEQAGFIQDLDSLPYYDKTLWEDHIILGDEYQTIAARGCPYRCTFCFNNFFAKLPEGKSGKFVRQRSVEHMMGELLWAKKRYHLRMIFFQDDVFTVNKKWLKEFLPRYKKEIGVPFECLTHPVYLDDDVSQWLSDAGCIYVEMGIQTMDDKYKFETIKRYEKSKDVEKAMDLMHKYRLRAKVHHMFGLPDEPLEAQEKARELYVKYPPYRIGTFWTTFLPGTEMVHQALELGLIDLAGIERINDGLEFDFYRDSIKIKDLKKLKAYKAYEVIFKLIPIMPGFIRKRLKPENIYWIPNPVLTGLTFLIDVCLYLILGDHGHKVYAKHYLYHLSRIFLRKFGIKLPAPTRLQPSQPTKIITPKAETVSVQ